MNFLNFPLSLFLFLISNSVSLIISSFWPSYYIKEKAVTVTREKRSRSVKITPHRAFTGCVRSEEYDDHLTLSLRRLVHAFITSRIDCCNTVLAGSPRTITDRLRRLLNAAARVVSNTGKFDRGLTHLLHSELHWLHVPQRILHKLGVTVHRCLQSRAPQYLMNSCHPTSDVASRQRLRSSSRHHLVAPRHRRSTLGRGAFSVAGPMAWNALPDDLRDPSLSADNFRNRLKTHLFRNALGHSEH